MISLSLNRLRLFLRLKFSNERRMALEIGGAESIFMTEIPVKPQPFLLEVPIGIGDLSSLCEFYFVGLCKFSRKIDHSGDIQFVLKD